MRDRFLKLGLHKVNEPYVASVLTAEMSPAPTNLVKRERLIKQFAGNLKILFEILRPLLKVDQTQQMHSIGLTMKITATLKKIEGFTDLLFSLAKLARTHFRAIEILGPCKRHRGPLLLAQIASQLGSLFHCIQRSRYRSGVLMQSYSLLDLGQLKQQGDLFTRRSSAIK